MRFVGFQGLGAVDAGRKKRGRDVEYLFDLQGSGPLLAGEKERG